MAELLQTLLKVTELLEKLVESRQCTDVSASIPSRIEAEAAYPVTLQAPIDELQRLVNLRVDTTLVGH